MIKEEVHDLSRIVNLMTQKNGSNLEKQ